MKAPLLEQATGPASGKRAFEIVERKGLGHPDSICDAIMEEAARALARLYLERSGQVQHFNLDKALWAAGRSSPRFGGGTVDEPSRLVFGDRALAAVDGHRLPVAELVEATARSWIGSNLRFFDPDRHLVFQSELRSGSAELLRPYLSGAPAANDTSVGVGFAPWTETERLVVRAERYINLPSFKQQFPETGEDVKVLGVRRDGVLELTVALAFVDGAIDSEHAYFEKKAQVQENVVTHLQGHLERIGELKLRCNTLDAPNNGERGVYLTVTGTSAEGADSGEVGRGNRLLGFNSATRPWSAEAVAGKNPLAHVGKIYNHLAQRAAERIAALEEIEEASVLLVSEIGAPLDEPSFAAVRLVLEAGVGLDDVKDTVEATLKQAVSEVVGFVGGWLRGEDGASEDEATRQ